MALMAALGLTGRALAGKRTEELAEKKLRCMQWIAANGRWVLAPCAF